MDSELLGPLLVEENLLVPEQLELAQQFALSSGLPLDQIVVAEFAVPQPDISRLLARVSGGADGSEGRDADPDVPTIAPIQPLGIRIRRPIGQIFVDLGFITADDREAALKVQHERGGLLGEILIEQGKLTRLELANALSEHWETGVDKSTSSGRPPSLIAVTATEENSPTPGLSDLRRSLDELEAARAADTQRTQTRMAAIEDALAELAPRDADEFRQATSERLDELADKLESVEGSPGSAELDARLLALGETLDDRLAKLAAELRTETASTAGISIELQTQVTELAASIEALGDTAAGQPETEQAAESWVDELRRLSLRIDDLDRTRQAHAQATKTASDELQMRIDELIDLRATDLEATQAAQTEATHAAAEAGRIEQALRSEIELLASSRVEVAEPDERVDDLKHAFDALATTVDDRLATLATELRAEIVEALASGRVEVAEPDERVDDLKHAFDALATTVDDRLATLTTELRAEIVEAEKSRAADAEATESISSLLRDRLDELTTLRGVDLEAIGAAHAEASHAAAESTRVEQTLRSEIEMLVSRQVDAESDARVDELAHAIEALSGTVDDRLATLTAELRAEITAQSDEVSTQLRAEVERVEESRATDAEATMTASRRLQEALDELTALRAADLESAQNHTAAEANRIEQTLRSELEAVASRLADAEPNGRVNELAHTIHSLTQATDERLTTLASELRAETITRADEIAEQHQAQVEALVASIDALREVVTDSHAEIEHDAGAWAAEHRVLGGRLDELIALRAADLEAARAAQAQAAAETARLEQTFVGALAELAVQLDDVTSRLGDPTVVAEQPTSLDSVPWNAGKPGHAGKRSKRAKGKDGKEGKERKSKKRKH